MTSATEQEVTNPPPSFGNPDWPPPEGAVWVPVTPAPTPTPAPDVEDNDGAAIRSEAPASQPSHRKHVGAVTAAGGIVGGVALFQAYGIIGLLAAGGAVAGLVAVPAAAYVLRKRRGRNRTLMGRSRKSHRPVRGRTTSRLGSTGVGRGRTRLGGRGGPKLGGKSGRLLGGKAAKLGGGKAGLGKGKSGLGSGKSKSGLLGSKSRSGKLLGGGRGSGLGGKLRMGRKAGLGLGAGGRARGRSASTASRSGGLTNRAGRGGLNLGKRGGRAAHGAVGRWSKSSGGGAGILGKKAATATRRRASAAAQRAARTRAGQRVTKAVQAAKHEYGHSTAKSPFARWRAATRAAYTQLPGTRSYSAWAAGVGAGMLALLAALHLRFTVWRDKRTPPADAPPRPVGGGPASSSPDEEADTPFSWTHPSDTFMGGSAPGDAPFTPPPAPPPTIKVEVIRDEPIPRAALTAAPLAIGPGRTAKTEPTRKEHRMGSFPLLAAAEEFNAVATKYTPENAHGLAPDFDQLPKVIANIAAGLRNYARRVHEEEPVHQAITEALFDLFSGVNQLVSTAETVGPLHRKVHEADIARAENPRANEARWNTPV